MISINSIQSESLSVSHYQFLGIAKATPGIHRPKLHKVNDFPPTLQLFNNFFISIFRVTESGHNLYIILLMIVSLNGYCMIPNGNPQCKNYNVITSDS